MRSARRLALALCLCPLALLVSAVLAGPAVAATGPAWNLTLTPMPSNFVPGGHAELLILATDIGGEPTGGPGAAPSEIVATLPPALTPVEVEAANTTPPKTAPTCAIDAPSNTVTCQTAETVLPGQLIRVQIGLDIGADPAASSTVQVSVTGGGAQGASRTATPPLQGTPRAFGFEPPGLLAPLTEADGSAAILAGSHPYQQTISFGFPVEATAQTFTNAGHPRDVVVELPPGLIGNPTATPVLCTELQLQNHLCPDSSQAGVLNLTTSGGSNRIALADTPIYEMVPPPGSPAELAFDVSGLGLFAHLFASVRSDGDYGIDVTTPDILALGLAPIFDVQTQVWGDPTSPLLDRTRGACIETGGEPAPCQVPREDTAFWTLPSRCDSQPLLTSGLADSWEEPGIFQRSDYRGADLGGSPVAVSGCAALQFKPTISVQPTTNLTDSPSGLEVDLHQPQDNALGEEGKGRSTAQLRDATVTLPEGMSVNPSQADGRGVCSASQIGLTTALGASPVHFSKDPASCPDAARLGTVEVTTPLLAQRSEGGTKLVLDPETKDPLLRPLQGSVYLAKPFANPFGSLLALYLDIEDPQSGTVAKLAGEVHADPRTGQLTTVFADNPQLPIEDIRLALFGGARGPLITPPACATHTTTTDLVPWSAPEGADAHPQSSFQTTATPAGGSCPTSAAAAPNSPSFEAGTLSPQAGTYSPFVLKLSREDGSQRIAGIDTTLAPGLIGKLAGIPECPEAAIARASARSAPEEGITEREDPSCPPTSQVGVVDVGAGAGPTPLHTPGHAYLAGPYKGAPLSLAIITPAIAGPFDLGTVVVRTALYVDPFTAQIHAVSDPFPQILDGIPLDIRSVALQMDRPGFTLNPTSCDPLAITATATSALGQGAALSRRFQVGGCSSLAFKPKLSLRLKGKVGRTAHPKLVANLTARPGEANIASAQVKLPKAAFLDQGHIKTTCTRVQWAADTCPPGSVYGRATATSPLVDYPLSGSVYLRSSSHVLPDLAVKLKGPASQPLEIDLLGKTDSVKGALRNSFEAVPDAPVSHFRLELFGGGRGLVEMSEGFCGTRRATVKLTGQNGKAYDTRPVVGAKCPKQHKRHGHGKKHHKRGAGA